MPTGKPRLTPGARKGTPEQARQAVYDALQAGANLGAALERAGRSLSWHELQRKQSGEYAARVDLLRGLNKVDRRNADEPMPSFEDFRRQYLFSETFTHQRHWIDLLEGRPLTGLHPSCVYEPGQSARLLINTPPNHCAIVSTPILTGRGWTTVGEVTEDDWVFGPDGQMAPVMEVWEPEGNVDLFEVTFNTGDRIVTDAGHVWQVRRSANHPEKQMTTQQLRGDLRSPSGQLKWRVRVADPVEFPERDLPLDPYLLGYWLGDGDSNGYRIATDEYDVESLVDNIRQAGFDCKVDPQLGGHSVYVYGMTKHLRSLGLIKNKRIPVEYMTAGHKQRLALLQGLLDSDGTITAKDGRAKFVQSVERSDLATDVYRLIASLGYQPRRTVEHASTTTPQGTRYHTNLEVICFKPDAEPVFRLERKASRQWTTEKNRRTDYRTVASVAPMGTGAVRCISTLTTGNLYLLGDGLIPQHNAKSMTITIDYATYRICRDPNVRIIIVSKTQEQAKKYLRAIKSRLSNPRYAVMQAKFGPEGGYQKTSESWTATQIYVGGEARDSGEKDPTVEALGIGGQIYGARADLIILDDVVTTANSHEWEKQLDWLRLEVQSRLGPGGKLLVVGTRIASVDLYKALRDPKNYSTGKVPWTYLAQPALLETAEDPEDWVTLWPRSDVPFEDTGDEVDADGLFPRWNGHYLSEVKDALDARTWAMVYQQQDTSEDEIFHPVLVRGCVNGMRKPGPLREQTAGHPIGGGLGHRVICGLDPAAAGDAGWVAYSVDPQTGKRYVLDAYRMQNPTPQKIYEQLVQYTERFNPSEWVIEKNGMNRYVTQDDRIRDFLRSRGVQLKEHFTGKDKWDVDYGVASLAPLFGRFDPDAHNNMKKLLRGSNLIELPDDITDGIKSLVEQLVTWAPETKNKTDMVMALWFVEIRAREYMKSKSASQQQFFLDNPFATASQLEERRVINLTDYIEGRRNVGYIA